MRFENRQDAGKQLAEKLREIAPKRNLIVLAVPRGGVEVGRVIADHLRAPFDVVMTKKIPSPENSEYAIGALAEDGEMTLNPEEQQRIPAQYLSNTVGTLSHDLHLRSIALRGERPLPDLNSKTVILADDGIATGYTMQAAVAYVRRQHPKRIIVAAPVAPRSVMNALKSLADKVVVLHSPDRFGAVGEFYEHFPQVSDEEVKALLFPLKNV